MPLLSFEVYSNYEEVTRLRSEITMLENRLRSFGPGTSVSTIRAVEAQLQSARAKFRGLALDAAQAGASLELNIRKGANGAIDAINDLQQKLTDPIQGLTQIAGVAGLGMFLNNVTKIRGQFQLMETNINTLLGSAEKGQAMMADLTEYAKVSPLDFQGTVGAAQMMLGFGIDQQKILPFMKALGDVSMGDAQRFQSLTLAFSQMSAAGKLMGQDLMQMVNAGFQPLDQLAKDTGKSIGQLKEEMSQGKISAEMVQQAFINATSEGGKFYNMSQAATATITGQMSMLGDATDLMFNDLGKKSEDAIIKVIEGATWMVENYEKVGGVLGTAIATFGIYKASAMASEFAIKVAAEERSKAVVQGFEEEIAKMEEYQRQRALMAFDEDVRGALETGSISTEMAEKIQLLREEVNARKDAAQAAVDAARKEQSAINDALQAANEKVNKAQEMVDIAEQIGDAEDQAAASAELLAAQMEREALTTQLANSQTQVHEAEMALDTATTQANTISQIQQTNATNANTAAQNTNTVATGRGRIATALSTAGNKIATVAQYAYTTAINACTKAWHSLKVAFATNPIGLIITALTTVIGLFMTFKNETEEASAEMERFGEAANKTKSNVNTLFSVLDSVNKESKVYKDSLEELTKIAKDYGIQIDSEKDTLDQLNEKRAQLIALIEKEGEARQIANRIASYEEDKKKHSDNFIKDMADSISDESEGDAKDNAERFARIMADTVDRKKKELLPLINELEQLQKAYSLEASKGNYADHTRMADLHNRIASLQNNIAKTANEEAKNYAKAMEMSEDYILDIKDTSKLVGELTKQITTADKFISQTEANAQAVNAELERTKEAAPDKTPVTLDKRDKSKSKGNDDPKQRAYELRKAKIEEEKRTTELLLAEKNRQRELDIAQMEDDSEKEIATIKFTSEKKRQALEAELKKEASTLEKNALQEWMKGGKNRKEYQYYAQFSDAQLAEMRKQYQEQARENVGYDTQLSLIANNEASELQKVYQTDVTAMRDYLREYGTFQQKKLAIAEEYAEKIRNAQNKGEELTLTAQRDTEIRNLESKAMTSKIDWYSVFDNVGVIMRGQLEPLYKQLQEYVKSDAFRKSGADNQQTVINAMKNLRTQLGTTESWKDLSSALADYQNALNELRVATENDTRVNEELAKLTEAKNTADINLEKARNNADTTPAQLKEYTDAVEAAQAAMDNYAATVVANNQAMQEAQNQVQSSGTLLSMTAKNVMQPVSEIYTLLSGAGLSQLAELWGAFDQLKGGIDGLKALKDIGKDTKELNDGMAEAGAEIAKELPAELTEGLSKAGLISQIVAAVLKILDILKDGVGTLISSILDSVFNAISGIIDNILSGEIFKQIGESLYKGILGIFKSVFTMGGLFDWWGNGESDKNLEKDIERLTATNEALRKAVDNLATEMREAATADMGDLYRQQKADIEQSMKNTQEMMQRSGAAYSNGFLGIGGHKSSNNKINKGMSGSDWSRISSIVGKSVQSAGDFWKLTSEQMAKIAQSAPDLYAKIKGLADDGYKDAAQFMDEYIEYYKELEELETAFRESLTDVSFDSVKDDFKSLLLDMESDSKDFASNWEKMMQQAVINSLMNSKYNDLLKKWYEGFADAMNDDNGLTEEEQAKLKKEWDSIVNSAITDRDSLKKAMGWDTGSAYSQEASKAGVTTITEDTGLAIIGRMTAMQEAVESIKATDNISAMTLADMTDELIQIAMEYSRFNVHQDNIERQLAKIYIELQTISENTGAIVKPIQTMQADIAEIKKNTKNL